MKIILMTYLLIICSKIDLQKSIGTETRLKDVVTDEHFFDRLCKRCNKKFGTLPLQKIFCRYKNGMNLLLIYKQEISLRPKNKLKNKLPIKQTGWCNIT